MSAYFDQFRLEEIFRKIIEQLDRIEANLNERQRHIDPLDGDTLLDNQDLCEILKVSKRTLQRYRSSEGLPYEMIRHKTYYKPTDVKNFIQTQFNKRTKQKDADETHEV